MASKDPGYVYILTNPSFREDWVKIGKTKDMENRLKTLDNTSVPLPFEVFATLKTLKYNEAEKLVHKYIERFTNLRIRDNREFFNVKPEEALEIFKDISGVLDDAEIDEVYKKQSYDDCAKSAKSFPVGTRYRDEARVWLMACNSKYFDIEACRKKYGEVYWSQYFKFQKGDIGYLYSSHPDSSIRYRFEVLENDIEYSSDMDKELEFFVDAKDFEVSKKHNRFALFKFTAVTNSNRLSLAYLLDHGLKIAPRGAMNLSTKENEHLLQYIEENF
jgi:hypothetical protein